MRNRRCALAALLAALLATACTATTSGKVVPAPNLSPRPLTGSAIKRALLDGAALSKLLNQPFQTVPPFPPVFGGSEKLVSRYGSASPPDCVGVAYMTHRNAYQFADVRNVADELWRADGSSEKVSAVQEGIVSLSSPAAASALFAKFATQWKQCDGTTLTVPSPLFVHSAITDVRVMDPVVAATVTLEPGPQSILAAVPEARAIGVQGNCLVEVEVPFAAITYPSDQGSAEIDTTAVTIARAMMDKISALS